MITPSAPPAGTSTSAVTVNDLFLMLTTLFSDSRPIPGKKSCEFPPDQGGPAGEARLEPFGATVVERQHHPVEVGHLIEAIGIFGDSVLYVNLDECTSCTACYQLDVCPVGAIYADEHVPDGSPNAKYKKADTAKGRDHTFFVQLSRDVFAD
jgi:NAD-dependent dihydropyrimidine dehydrogenase PreA subunit